MSKPWGGVGAWALEAERAEAEEREHLKATADSKIFSGGPNLLGGDPDQSFPSLKEAASTKPKKKKGATYSLSEFNRGTYDGTGGARRESAFEPKGRTTENIIRLPSGPRDRSDEELEHSRLGGGFRSFGYGPGGGGGAAPPRRRSEFGLDDDQRRGSLPHRDSDIDLPSRADEVDNWASGKKFAPATDSGRQERFGSMGSGGSSKADEVQNWSMGKASVAPSRTSGFGSGFRDPPARGGDSDRWIRSGGGSHPSNGERERPRLVLDPPRRDSGSQTEAARNRPSPFGAARPREDVLAEKGLDWRKMETEIEVKKVVRPTSSQSSRPSSAQSSRPGSPVSQVSGEGGAPKPRTKVNPFGNAKPREVLLEEKGMDWRKIDLELDHRRVERTESDEEKMLKEEIDHLKKELAKETEGKVDFGSALNSTEQLSSLHEQICQMEKALDQLTLQLDDKVRFGQRSSMDVRPGSGSGRIPFSADRPPSQSGISEDSRNIEYVERPRSRGMGDIWSRPMDERRGFQMSRDSGFLSSRSTDRSKSRDRW